MQSFIWQDSPDIYIYMEEKRDYLRNKHLRSQLLMQSHKE